MGASSAAAQAWAADRARAEGRGIRLGDFELHPGIGSEIGYDSNVFLADDPEGSAVLRVSPHIYLSTLSGERLQGETPRLSFRAGARGAFKYWFEPAEGDIGAGQDARLVWRPSSIFSLELFDEYTRTIDPFVEPASPVFGGEDDLEYERDQLGAGTRLQLSTPGGLLKGGLGYRFDLDYFESDLFRSNTNLAHNITADSSWEFLPKTALFWNGSLQFHRYDDDHRNDAITERNDSTRVQSKLGLNGALTPRIGLTIAGGYAAGFFDDDNDYESVIAQVEARWNLREAMLWALGYDREFSTAFQGNFARMDRIKTRLQAMFGGVFLLGARVELTFVDFGRDDRLADPERNDIHLLTNLNGEYRLADWFAITAEFGYIENFTDYVYEFDPDPADPTNDLVRDDAGYRRFEGWLGVRAFL